jgi:oxygen-dependent protoporphyrinogen oxidase
MAVAWEIIQRGRACGYDLEVELFEQLPRPGGKWEIIQRGRACGYDLEVELFEQLPRPGGKVWTEQTGGYLVEQGPEGFLSSSPRTLELAAELGIAEDATPASTESDARYVYADGRLHRVPMGPPGMLRSRILSLGGRLRLFCEPFMPRGRNGEESVTAFATRRLGWQAAERLVGPMVSGIHAGDPERLSMAAAFPKLVELERRYGSLTRGLIASKLEAKRTGARVGGPSGPAGRLTSFKGGLRQLMEALRTKLGDVVRFDSEVVEVRSEGDQWRVGLAAGQERSFDSLVIATEPWYAATLLHTVDGELAEALAGIPSTPVVAVALGFRESEIGGSPAGFGFLVPRGEGVRILGCLWSSSTFPNRAPQGNVLLRALLGGMMDQQAVNLGDEDLLDVVFDDLKKSMGITATPELVRIFRYPRAIPQYTLGHLARLDAVRLSGCLPQRLSSSSRAGRQGCGRAL